MALVCEIHPVCLNVFFKEHGKVESSVATESAEGPTLNLGFLHGMFACCLPSNSAIFLVILVTFLLSASDALSDMALSYFLFSRYNSE